MKRQKGKAPLGPRGLYWENKTYKQKPVFHVSGKSQTIADFIFCRPSQILPIYRIIARPQFFKKWITLSTGKISIHWKA